jgi:hypothetical protein
MIFNDMETIKYHYQTFQITVVFTDTDLMKVQDK